MTTNAVPLDSLAQRIAQQQSELEALRRELESRQDHLARLKEKKEALEQSLHSLDSEIDAVSQGKSPPHAAGKPQAKPAAPASPIIVRSPKNIAPSPVSAKPPKRMADLLVDIIREAKAPLIAKTLAAELQRQGFFTTSPNLLRIVQVRLNELVREGVLRRDQAGVVLGKPIRGSKAKTADSKKGRTNGGGPKGSFRVGQAGKMQPSLRSIVTEILAKSTRPLPARELGERAKVKGYVSESKDFASVLRALLSKMNNVESVPGEGYRLKK
jgi:uncharacterized coiled-coil protein SlyX